MADVADMDELGDLPAWLRAPFEHVEQSLGAAVTRAEPLAGGDVAAAFRADLADGRTIFVKTHADPPAHFFDTEAIGLEWLRSAGSVAVPTVLVSSDDPAVLALEWIDESDRSRGDESAFGRSLAALHLSGAPCFGRSDARTTGSRALPNQPCDTWAQFYATQRIEPLIRLASAAQVYSTRELQVFSQVVGRLEQVGPPAEPPSRLHGDLWAGNRLVDRSGRSWLIDPACHGGHREFDLAMMALFGGFGRDAFESYRESAPLADGWQDRVQLHQLAPLLVHAVKFGGSYVGAALAAARSYC